MRNIQGPPVKNLYIADDVNGNIQTVKIMRKLALEGCEDPYIRRITEQIVHGIPSHYFFDEAVAVGNFVKENVRYLLDPTNVERLTVPGALLQRAVDGTAQGDCDDMALLTATMLLTIGHDPVFRAVRYEGFTGPFNHIYVVDTCSNNHGPKRRVVLDCILKQFPIGYEVPHASGYDFAIA